MTDHSTAPPPAAPPPTAPRSGNGPAVAALVLGIVGVVIAWIPVLGIVGIICGIIALILGIVGARKVTKRETTSGKGMAITGAVLGVVAVLLGVLVFAALGSIFSQISPGELDQIEQELQELEELQTTG